MKYFVWIGTGAMCVGIPFMVLFDPHDMWGSVTGGIIGAAGYLIVLVVRSQRHLPSRLEKSAVVSLTLLFLTAYGAYTATFHEMSSYQRNLLPQIRTYLGSGIIVSDKIYASMLPVLRTFHHQTDNGRKKSLVAVFRERYGPSIADGSFNTYPHHDTVTPETDALTFVSFSGDTAVHYICIDTVARGYNNEFVNASGHTGKLQFAATLSRNGVRYERIN
ncbi:MAG: hypothetical protein HUU02_06605 [Bacteroidetes bacterium]|nr:hypothetical protein [Bacteroidota bacterium]